MEIDKIYNKDCLEFMRELPNESIDLIATDPPYRLTSRGSSGTMSGFGRRTEPERERYLLTMILTLKTISGSFTEYSKPTRTAT